MSNPITSRRALLAALAGAAVPAGGLLRGAGLRDRTLVCVRLVEGTDADGMIDARGGHTITSSISRDRFGLHSSLAGVQQLFEQRSAAFVEEDPSMEEDRAYLMNGFTAPRWMMRASGADIRSSAGHAFPFRSGLLMLSPDWMSFAGESFDNPGMVAAAKAGDFSFPNTGIGLQLRQIAGLLASKGDSRMMFVASLGGSVTVGDEAAQRAARLRQLDAALVSFQSSLVALGVARDVVTFTDADVRPGVPRSGRRLVVGGSIIGGEVYMLGRGRNQASAALAKWAGYRPEQLLPDATEPSGRFLY